MRNTKVLVSMAAVGILLALPIIVFRQEGTPTPMPAPAPAVSAKNPAPQPWPKAEGTARPRETKHYRPAPVSDEVRSKADAIIRRHAGMTRAELMQSDELMALMERMIAVMNSPGVLSGIEKSIAEVQAVTGIQGDGSMTLDWFDTLEGPKGRAWLEAAVSEKPERMEEWLVNRFNGSIFEFAIDPTLEKSSEGLTIVPAKPAPKPTDNEKND